MITNERNKKILASQVETARGFFQRLMGLMGRAQLNSDHGLLIPKSGNSIHTCFMRFAIDAVFFDKNGIVKHTAENLKPWRMTLFWSLSNTDVLELPAGTLSKTDTRLGDQLRVAH
jgi:uncharacterized membrane protein (UPF0127 family)